MKKILFLFILFFMGIQGVFALTPTIHSTESGGNWNNVATWVEGRVPAIDDITEINGNVSIVANTTIGGVLITGSGQLRHTASNYNLLTLTINGATENNGIIGGDSSAYMNRLNLHFKGDVINNGSLSHIQTL